MGVGQASGVYSYDWGNIARYEFNLTLGFYIIFYLSILFSCRLLYGAYKREVSPMRRRHITYILASFIVFCIAQLKILVTLGIDIPFILPSGMFLIDLFGALIGIAIIKEQLFDITVFVRKGIIYSVLTALIIFIFDFSQHLIAAFLGDIAGEHSTYIHFASIGVIVIAFMPLKQRLEHMIGGLLAKKKIEF